ncbi:WYL domain-containing protein [Streptomyces sp. NPDC057486]|uniref:WYL domain-containing protein n=1 Tax=Streptomyces sp. NPDC057486 TaxID=3346145 RepID=UPI00369416E2
MGARLRIGRELAVGRVEIEADAPSLDVLARQLAGLGSQVDVVGPPEARKRPAYPAGELASLCSPSAETGGESAVPDEFVDLRR